MPASRGGLFGLIAMASLFCCGCREVHKAHQAELLRLDEIIRKKAESLQELRKQEEERLRAFVAIEKRLDKLEDAKPDKR